MTVLVTVYTLGRFGVGRELSRTMNAIFGDGERCFSFINRFFNPFIKGNYVKVLVFG